MKRTALFYISACCALSVGVQLLYADDFQAAVQTKTVVPKRVLQQNTAARPIVYDIHTAAGEDALIITWKLDAEAFENIAELLIFRSSERISDVSSVPATQLSVPGTEQNDAQLGLIAAVNPSISAYTDTTITKGKIYYYAVVAREKQGILYDLLIPSVNTAVTGCSVGIEKKVYVTKALSDESAQKNEKSDTQNISPAPSKPVIVLREKPLPTLHIFSPNDQSDTIKNRISRRPVCETKGGLQKTVSTQNTVIQSPFSADILPEEKNDTGVTGDDYTLFAIVDNSIKTENWAAAEKELTQFLQINRSTSISARASFYLGQALFFNGKYREALSRFQYSGKLYPVLSKRWSTRVLDAYRID